MFIYRKPHLSQIAIAGTLAAGLLASVFSFPAAAFQVNPYLQQPSTDGMYFFT